MEDGSAVMISTKNPLKVFNVINHVGNQYELYKLMDKYPIQFYVMRNNVRKWEEIPEATNMHRPLHPKIKWVSYYEPGFYDLALLHTDQQHVNPQIGKGHLYKQLNELIQDIPKMVIQHGSPDYLEMYEEDMVINGGTVHHTDGREEWIPGMKQLIGNNFMVVNSYEAVKRWGWGYPVIHGMNPEEWWDLPKEPRATVQLSPGGMDHYNNRELLSHIKSRVQEKTGTDLMHISVSIKPRDWDEQRWLLGTSLISITQAKDSPMPRSRTEAMLSGCCILTSKYHNADEFIEQGVNGFVMPDNPLSYAEVIDQLINVSYKDAIQIGQRGKETAKELFNWNVYAKDMFSVLEAVANKKPPKWDGSKRWS